MIFVPYTNTNGFALLDIEDARLLLFNWLRSKDGYVMRTDKVKRYIYMHHDVIGFPPYGLETDHKNRIRHDNRRSNLHHVTHAQNMQNRASSTSRFLGVFLVKTSGRWRARIKKEGVTHHLGNFRSELDAAAAYNRAALLLYGVTATLNDLDSKKQISEKLAE